MIDKKSVWTMERVRNSLPEEVRDDHERYTQERRDLFYRGVAATQNLIEKKGWELDMEIYKGPCSFSLDKAITRIKKIFRIILPVHLPYGSSVDRNGRIIGGSLTSTPPRLIVRIKEEKAKQLEHDHDGCEFCAVSKDKVDMVYYNIPENMSKLLPVLEFAYNKHRGK